MSDTPSYSYVITFRDDFQGRRENLIAVLGWLSTLEDTEVLVIEQDSEPHLDVQDLPGPVEHVFVRNPCAFNKSWGFNVGARRARGGVIALADADLLVDPRVVQESFAACRGDTDALNPYTILVDLDPEQTRGFRRTGSLAGVDRHRRRNRMYKGEYLCFCGGLYLIRRQSYLDLGGQDERFSGWGGEDDAMSVKLRLLERVAVNREGLAYHLYHRPPPGKSMENPGYRANTALLREYAALSDAGLREMCRTGHDDMGNPDKYGSE